MVGTRSAIKNGYAAFEYNMLKLLKEWQPTAFDASRNAIAWRNESTEEELRSDMLTCMDPLEADSLMPPLPKVPWDEIAQMEKPLSGREIAQLRKASANIFIYVDSLAEWHIRNARENK